MSYRVLKEGKLLHVRREEDRHQEEDRRLVLHKHLEDRRRVVRRTHQVGRHLGVVLQDSLGVGNRLGEDSSCLREQLEVF